MTTVFLVQHVHDLGDDREDVKFIGVYSSQASAEQAVERMRSQPGFREIPEGFSVDAYTVDKDCWTEGFVTMIGDKQQSNTP